MMAGSVAQVQTNLNVAESTVKPLLTGISVSNISRSGLINNINQIPASNIANEISGQLQPASQAYQCIGACHDQDYSQKQFDPAHDKQLAKQVAKEAALMLAGGWAVRGGVWIYRGAAALKGSKQVYASVKATQSVMVGTSIPKSFELAIGHGKRFWVHPNATKHMAEYVSRGGLSHSTSNKSQAILSSLQHAVKQANTRGIEYGKMVHVGRWELMFNKGNANDVLPVIYHALYK